LESKRLYEARCLEKNEEMTENKLTQSIVSIAKDTGEALLDNTPDFLALFKDCPILKDIPALNIGYSLVQSYYSIRDQLFYKKLEEFIHNLGAITEDEKNNFINEMNDEKFKSKVGENLLLIIDKLDDMNKPKIISKLFREYIRLHITYDEFIRLSHVVQSCPINALNKVQDIYPIVTTQNENTEGIDQEYKALDRSTLQDLFLCGLLKTPGSTHGNWPLYQPNQLGKLYVENISR
jgi:hypothetical protein